MSEVYAGRQFVGMDLHRRRSVLVRMSETGEHLETVRILNDRRGARRSGDGTWRASVDHKTVFARNSDVLVDPDPKFGDPVVAIMVEPRGNEPFIVPMDLRAARDLALMMLDTVLQVSPAVALEPLRK